MADVVYYRGLLRSCNYHCPYCPFGKHPLKQKRLDRDWEALDRFCAWAESLDYDISIMLVPAGEALIHSYYYDALARLCAAENVRRLSCQTNVSFPVAGFLEHIAGSFRAAYSAGGQDIFREKIRLWCSFHPSQTTVEDFLAQCMLLHKNRIRFCAGAVGDPLNLDLIAGLRGKLPPEIYLWINAMEGMRRVYTPEERAAFTRIDPLFPLEIDSHPADPARCTAGRDSVFVEGNGDMFACNISGVKLGNLYEGTPPPAAIPCRARDCHCFLAYVNRSDIAGLDTFGAERFCRMYPPRNRSRQAADMKSSTA